MPIINAIKNDPGYKKMKLTSQFEKLGTPQKEKVLSYIKSGGKEELDTESERLVKTPDFSDMFMSGGKPPLPLMLMGILNAAKKVSEVGKLNPEYSERMGGTQRESSPFDMKFESAYKTEGVRGLARLHKNMLNDVEYQHYLDGVQ